MIIFGGQRVTIFMAVAMALLVGCHGPTGAGEAMQVQTASGIVESGGTVDGVRIFRGIPFAQPPVGDLRWRPPQPVSAWSGVRHADKFGPRPMQLYVFNDMRFRSPGISEDCLYLNVWTPANASSNANLPVLVYFYGGGYYAGDSSEYRYDGASLARRGIVVVTCNYRLGVFGFLAHPELTAESPQHASGDYGLLDQSAALHWVHDNIAGFGGDPKHITIGGESAGSFSVAYQMASPLSRDLIVGAIGQSGGIVRSDRADTLEHGEEIGVKFATAVGANSLADLRAMSATSLLQAIREHKDKRVGFPVVVDGYFLPKPAADIYAAGEQAHVPLLVGWTTAEMGYRPIIAHGAPTLANFIGGVYRLYGDQAENILKVYAATNDAEAFAAAVALGADRSIAFGTWKWADLAGKTGGQPVYRFRFDHARPAVRPEQQKAVDTPAPDAEKGGEKEDPDARSPGAHHAWDIEYSLGNLDTNPVYAWNEDDQKVSELMESYFANFIKTGDPNGDSLPHWPAANSGDGVQVMHLDVTPHVEPEAHRERYLLLDSMPATRPAR